MNKTIKLDKNTKCYEFYVQGMHCGACEILLEKKLAKDKKVKKVKASLSNEVVIIETDSKDREALAKELSKLVEKDGYTLYTKKELVKHIVNWKEFYKAIPIALCFAIFFLILQKLKIVNLVSGDETNYAYVFLIGVIASLSTCMAVVGGLVLSLSTKYAKSTRSIAPQLSFHLSRIISFFFLGGLIGILGSAFKLTPITNFLVSIILVSIMVILAFNIMDIFPFLKKFQLRMPKFLSKNVIIKDEVNHFFAPILLGTLTFVLPCGFTQAMQLQALKSGTFFGGALTMLVFALGTFPVLGLVSFASVKFSESRLQSPVFFKVAGLIILFFAIINLLGALAVMGIIPPVLNI